MNGCTAEPVVGGGLGGSGPAQELQPTKQQPHLAAAAATSVFETHYTKEYKGRGVRATRSIARGTLVETSHCILMPRQQYADHGRHTVLEHYLFYAKDGDMLLALGLGSLFNHSRRPNLDYRVDGREQARIKDTSMVIRFYAARHIEAAEELTIFYGTKLWFEDRREVDAPSGSPAVSSDSDDDVKMLARLQI